MPNDKKVRDFREIEELRNSLFTVASLKKRVKANALQRIRKENKNSYIKIFKRTVFAKAMGIDRDKVGKSSFVVVVKDCNSLNKNFRDFFEIKASYCFSRPVDLEFAKLCEKLNIRGVDELKAVLLCLVLSCVIKSVLATALVPAIVCSAISNKGKIKQL